MAKRKPVPEPIRLEHAPGYKPDGVSTFSHKLAHGSLGMVTDFRDRAPVTTALRQSTVTELILKQRRLLANLVERLEGELTPDKRAKLESNRDIKIRFLEKLTAEYQELIRKGACDV